MTQPLAFLPFRRRPPKPRSQGITCIRGPYYSAVGPQYFADLLSAAGACVDCLKYAGGSFAIMEAGAVRQINDVAHDHDVLVSTGGFLERVFAWGEQYVARYLRECRELGFDTVEVSSGFVTMSDDDFASLIHRVRGAGLRAVAEVGIQRGAGGASSPEALQHAGTFDPALAVTRARRALDAGAELIMVESEGITEQVRAWRTDVIQLFARELGLQDLMFEAADPQVFEWYVRTFGHDVNLFVDHSQILQLEAARTGVWGTVETWGREL